METNNPLAQKKNTRMQPCQQLESHSSLSCSSIHPFVQQSVTIYQEPATGLGTSIKPSPSCWEAHSVAGGDRCINSFWYKVEGALGRFPLLPGRIGKGSQGTAFLPTPPPTLPAATWGVKVQARWVGEQTGILISYRGSALNLTSLHWGSSNKVWGVQRAVCSIQFWIVLEEILGSQCVLLTINDWDEWCVITSEKPSRMENQSSAAGLQLPKTAEMFFSPDL